MGPYLLGLLVARTQGSPSYRLRCRKRIPDRCQLDLSAPRKAMAPAAIGLIFSAQTSCPVLTYWTTRPDYQVFFKALPILGKDGTLAKIQNSPPAPAMSLQKTAPRLDDKLGGKMMLNGQRPRRLRSHQRWKRLAFAAYVNHVSLAPASGGAQQVVVKPSEKLLQPAYDANLDAAASAGGLHLIIRNAHIMRSALPIPGMPLTSPSAALGSPRSGDLREAHAKREIDAKAASSHPASLHARPVRASLLIDNVPSANSRKASHGNYRRRRLHPPSK